MPPIPLRKTGDSKMKKLLIVLGVIGAICELLEYLAIPAILAIIGAFNHFPWQYYAITIGGYFGLLLAGELLLRLIFHSLGKKYTSRITNKLTKLVNRINRNK